MAKSEYPYIVVAPSLRKFLKDMKTYGKPDKVTQKWLEGVGFKSTNDRRIIGVLKFVGLLGSDGSPTDLWMKMRGADGKAVLAEAIRTSYAPLFQTFPDAHRRDTEALLNFFRANTSLAEESARRCVTTFQVLAEAADWDSDPPEDLDIEELADDGDEENAPARRPQRKTRVIPPTGGLTLNINIQLQLPANADGKTYEQLFAAMGKHLKDFGGLG